MKINYAEYDVNGKALIFCRDGSGLTTKVIDKRSSTCLAEFAVYRDFHLDDTVIEIYRMGVRVSGAIYGTVPGEYLIRYGVRVAPMPNCPTDSIREIMDVLEGFDI